jgi:hypothetical protein
LVYREELYSRSNYLVSGWADNRLSQMNEKEVPTYPSPIDTDASTVDMEKYPKAGDPNPRCASSRFCVTAAR